MNRTDLIREISKANSVGNPVVDARIADHLIYLGFVMAEPLLYDKPIPCRGKLGFFKPDIKEAS
jgi:hypothetical protein